MFAVCLSEGEGVNTDRKTDKHDIVILIIGQGCAMYQTAWQMMQFQCTMQYNIIKYG